MNIMVINGPNLNMLGYRPQSLYGSATLAELEQMLLEYGSRHGCIVQCCQYNSEGDIIDRLHSSVGNVDGIVINAGAYTHYSYAIRDAIECLDSIVVAVHITNIDEREEFRKTDVLLDVVNARYMGEGINSYYKAIDYIRRTV